ncbi:MAG TPA: amino acid adenylation domain-containing protein, partial [Polyangiaceae bacterium]|nr:amino acid adenylation domain-containing protein [Polyangiaceae bacterium]
IERVAAKTPDAVALRFGDRTLTYAALNRSANRVAHELIARGIGSGCRVMACAEPSLAAVVALLGIWKAGAAYVPLDPGLPQARIRAILDDTRPALVLAQGHLLEKLHFVGLDAVALEGFESENDARTSNPALTTAPEALAYVFFTSGTTGTPKGVMGSYANLFFYVDAARRRYELGPSDVVPALARFSFSISLFELVTPLVAGGTLLLLARDHVLDPARLVQTLHEVTLVHAGPGLWKGLVAHVRRNYPSFEPFERVRHASSGGDVVPPDLLESLKEIFARADVFVIYGASEIACMGTTYLVPRARRLAATFVGRPFEGVSLRVLDTANRALPPGVAGEIHFAGPGVTEGYLNRPELTSAQFVTLEGTRFYKTGDRGRLNHEGELEFLGRGDSQVKIRGMRVELGEVEQWLRRAPGVRDAAVAAHAAPDGEKMLVAYVVPDHAHEAASTKALRFGAVRRHLIEQLPDYMLPAAYVELERLPLNHNLKLDRRALPVPSEADLRALSNTALRAPQTHTERALGRLFQRHLGLKEVGLDDNFFELGGHSLLALKFCVDVEAELGARLEGIDLLREPLEILARLCERSAQADVPGSETVAPERASDAVEIFHFGPEASLYGALHGVPDGATHAVLVCGAVGQEHTRSRFVLGRLAKTLAQHGIPALCFDYFGTGDSLGESRDAGARRWQADVASAHAELSRRVPGARITAVGVRLGALLAADAARELAFTRLVLWDPVNDGHRHFAELSALTRRYLKSVAHLRFWDFRAPRPSPHELLGTHYSAAALAELTRLKLDALLAERRVPTRWLATREVEHEA